MQELLTSQFWLGLGAIIWVNIILSGDNAVVIALAARSLPARQQKQAIFWGAAAAVVLRIVLTIVAVELLRLPYLKLIGGALLLWIGVKLIAEEEGGEHSVKASDRLLSAIWTIIVADLVMSLDNVMAVAAAAKGNVPLIVFGLVISIPIVVFGSQLIMRIIGRFPVLVWAGGGLLGYIAGDMAIEDPAIAPWIAANISYATVFAPAAGFVLVVVTGVWLSRRRARLKKA